MLQAAFDRVNRNAGKKCVRGKVPVEKLLTANPWTQFTWVEGTDRPIRQFDTQELLGFLTYLVEGWPKVPVATLATKVLLWSCCRKLEVVRLTRDGLRLVDNEVHFEVVGKWGVERWFRLPEGLHRDMEAYRTESPFVFAAYTDQIRQVHGDNPGCLKKICQEFNPRNFGRWIYEPMKDWAATQPKGDAFVHVSRKTGLHLAHDGEEEEASQKVAADGGVSESVLLGHYVKPKLWRKSTKPIDACSPACPRRWPAGTATSRTSGPGWSASLRRPGTPGTGRWWQNWRRGSDRSKPGTARRRGSQHGSRHKQHEAFPSMGRHRAFPGTRPAGEDAERVRFL